MSNRTLKAKHRWYAFRGKTSSGEIAIDLMAEIGGWGISAKQFKDDLSRAGSNQPLHVHINSDGGEILAGFEIYNMLLEHEGNVRVSVGALAASIASVIAMAGDQISIAENGWLMIHKRWTVIIGDSDELRKVAGTLDKMKASIINAYQRQTGLSFEDINALMEEETWMDSEDALDKGFVDSIDFAEDRVTAVNDLRLASHFALSGFRNAVQFRNSINKLMSKQNQTIDPQGNGEPTGTELLESDRSRVNEIMALAKALRDRDKLDFR